MGKGKGMSVRMTIRGEKELRKFLKLLPKRAIKKATKAAVTAGVAPIVKSTRAKARGIKESGLMARSVSKKVKLYPSGVAIGLVGANSKVEGTYKGHRRVPSFYWHLVLGGARPHATGKGDRLARSDRPNVTERQTGRLHPGVKGNNILAQAITETRGQTGPAMEKKMKEVVLSEAAKLASTK